MSLDYAAASQVFAFLGNSLLKPMSQTADAGLIPEFWEEFPDFGDGRVRAAVGECLTFARDAKRRTEAGENMIERVSVEFTRLFVGPPRPAAPPWETAYRATGKSDGFVGFGEATVAMRHVLADLGLEVRNENNQYADHMGIELLCLSEMLRRVGEGAFLSDDARRFAETHPLFWCDALSERIQEMYPKGYFAALTKLAAAMLRMFGQEGSSVVA